MAMKSMPAKSCSLVFLLTFVTVQCVPSGITTSRYKEETLPLYKTQISLLLHRMNYNRLPQILDENVSQFNTTMTKEEEKRSFKDYEEYRFRSNNSIRNLTSTEQFIFPDELQREYRQFKNNKLSEPYSNFIQNHFTENKINSRNNTPIHLSKFSVNDPFEKNKQNIFIFNPNKNKILKNVLSHTILNKNRTEEKKNKSKIIEHLESSNAYQYKHTHPIRKLMKITNRPIILRLTTSSPITRKSTTKIIKHKTPGWISKIKSTTYMPPTRITTKKSSVLNAHTIKRPNGHSKNKNQLNSYGNFTQMSVLAGNSSMISDSKVKKKFQLPSKIIFKTKKKPNLNGSNYTRNPGNRISAESIKQNWDSGANPYPNPMPEISSPSVSPLGVPPFSLANEDSQDTDGSESVQVDAADGQILSNAISTFNLDMASSATNLKDSTGGNRIADGCPTVHISSSVLTPQQRQDCSDLNLVINSHFHQNTASDRVPSVDTYQSGDPEEEIPIEAVEEPVEAVGSQADPGIGQADPGLADAGGSPGGSPGGVGGTGASGGSGGNGGDGDDGGGLGWPDLKGMMDALDWIGNKFGHILRFFKNPYLYIIPAALFFLIGFFLVMALFPWWVPLLFLFLGVKSKPKPNIVHHKHLHKAIHHPDGWFWNHHTKSWENVQDYLHRKRIDNINLNHIPQEIDHFGKKYGYNSNFNKWRKKLR